MILEIALQFSLLYCLMEYKVSLLHQRPKTLRIDSSQHRQKATTFNPNVWSYEYTFCVQKRNKYIKIMDLLNNFFYSVSVYATRSWEYQDPCILCCWCRSVLMQKLDPLCFVYKQKKMHTLYKTVFINMSENFDKEVDLQLFAQPYLFEPEYNGCNYKRWMFYVRMPATASAAPHACIVNARQRLTRKRRNWWIKSYFCFLLAL